jgi:hypothetical protein
MPSNQDNDDDDKEHDDDDEYKLPPPHRTRFSTPKSDKSPKYDDAGLNSMLGNLAVSPCSATVAARQTAGALLLMLMLLCMILKPNIYSLSNSLMSMPSIQTTKRPIRLLCMLSTSMAAR